MFKNNIFISFQNYNTLIYHDVKDVFYYLRTEVLPLAESRFKNLSPAAKEAYSILKKACDDKTEDELPKLFKSFAL